MKHSLILSGVRTRLAIPSAEAANDDHTPRPQPLRGTGPDALALDKITGGAWRDDDGDDGAAVPVVFDVRGVGGSIRRVGSGVNALAATAAAEQAAAEAAGAATCDDPVVLRARVVALEVWRAVRARVRACVKLTDEQRSSRQRARRRGTNGETPSPFTAISLTREDTHAPLPRVVCSRASSRRSARRPRAAAAAARCCCAATTRRSVAGSTASARSTRRGSCRPPPRSAGRAASSCCAARRSLTLRTRPTPRRAARSRHVARGARARSFPLLLQFLSRRPDGRRVKARTAWNG